VLGSVLAAAGCGNEAIQWVDSDHVTKAKVNHGFRHSSPVDFPELVLSVLVAWDEGWETRSEVASTLCTVIFEPSDFSRSDVLWIGEGWIGTKSQDQSLYRDLTNQEADLLRVSFEPLTWVPR